MECAGELPALELVSKDMPTSTNRKTIARFPAPGGLRWEEVSFVFVSNDSVRVSARGTSRTYMFNDLGFLDGRKGDRPDTRWAVLRELARHGGEIGWEAKIEPKHKGRMKAAIKDIRRRLKELMDIKDDPFHPYRKKKAYVVKFELRDESYDGSNDVPDDD